MINTTSVLTDEQMDRYSRQILLPEIGVSGQAKLLDSKVVIVGAGGLGSPTAICLAAAGIGTIGLIDADTVDRSNLHRQVLHMNASVGLPKTTSARQHLESMNPDVTVVEHQERLTSENAMDIFSQYDLIINGSDNFPTRYLVNDACVLLNKPLVDASILRWEGQLNVFMPGQGCYRCLYPQPPKPGTVPSCAEAGIVGAVAGIMGSMQVMETIKILLGMQDVLCDRTQQVNIRTGSFRTIKRRRRPSCPVCGDAPTVHQLIDYEVFCGLPSANAHATHANAVAEETNLSPADAVEWLGRPNIEWIDMREADDFEKGHIPGSKHVPFYHLMDQLSDIPADRTVVLICNWGVRSATVVQALRENGHADAFNLAGGMLNWENQGLPLEGEEAEEGV